MEAPELQDAFLPILAIAHPEKPDLDPIENSEKYQAMLDVLPNCAVEIYEWWRKKLLVSMQATSAQGAFRHHSPRRAEGSA